MTTPSQEVNLFQAELISERVEYGALFQLYSNRIFYAKLPEYEAITPEILDAGYRFLDDNGGGRFYNVFEISSFTEIPADVRSWAADEGGNKYTITDAFVISSLGQKIIGDFYMKINKPIVPTKIFFSKVKAVNWTLQQIELLSKKTS